MQQAGDWDMSEEDQMVRAIAISLGENVTDEPDETAGADDDEKTKDDLVA